MALMEPTGAEHHRSRPTTRWLLTRNSCHETIVISRDVSRNDRRFSIARAGDFGLRAVAIGARERR
jgi:hypothetical protein